MSRPLSLFTTMMLTIAITAAQVIACPMCKESIPSSDAQQAGALPGGFNNSVYFLLISLFAVLGTVITIIVRAVREQDVGSLSMPCTQAPNPQSEIRNPKSG
jgi:hypothetical protein